MSSRREVSLVFVWRLESEEPRGKLRGIESKNLQV